MSKLTIFGGAMATGSYAMGSSEALCLFFSGYGESAATKMEGAEVNMETKDKKTDCRGIQDYRRMYSREQAQEDLCVLRYLRGTISRQLFFPSSSSLQLQVYSDATWASDAFDHHSFSA
jgi:hypothetical protein